MTQDGGWLLSLEGWALSYVTWPECPPERGRGLESEFSHMADDSVNPFYLMKPQYKLQAPNAQWSLLVAEHIHVSAGQRVWIPGRKGE